MTPEDRIRQIFMLHREGRSRAITRKKFLNRYEEELDGISDREFRRIYAESVPICTCNKGGFWPAHENELFEFGHAIEKKIEALKTRRLWVLKQHRHLFADGIPREWDGQGKLF